MSGVDGHVEKHGYSKHFMDTLAISLPTTSLRVVGRYGVMTNVILH